jgi:hypothetical protein
VILYSDPKNLL